MITFEKYLKNDNDILNIVDEYLKIINTKRNGFILEIEIGEKGYWKVNQKDLEKFLDKKLGELGISIELQKINKDDLLVSFDFNSVYPSAQIGLNRNWPNMETAYEFKKYVSDAVCSLCNSGGWIEIK